MEPENAWKFPAWIPSLLQIGKMKTSNRSPVDVRNASEVKERKIFPHSIHVPLPEWRTRIGEMPINKPQVVHCAGGYRRAAASSLIKANLNGRFLVLDLGENIKTFMK
jgi:hydroxyacylglutathione hydrolase